jgi:hypothetical protein
MQAFADLGHYVACQVDVEPASSLAQGCKDARQGLALDVFHRQEKLVVDFAECEGSDHVGVREQGPEASLTQEHFFAPGIARALGEKTLEGDDTLRGARSTSLEGHLDSPHAALA